MKQLGQLPQFEEYPKKSKEQQVLKEDYDKAVNLLEKGYFDEAIKSFGKIAKVSLDKNLQKQARLHWLLLMASRIITSASVVEGIGLGVQSGSITDANTIQSANLYATQSTEELELLVESCKSWMDMFADNLYLYPFEPTFLSHENFKDALSKISDSKVMANECKSKGTQLVFDECLQWGIFSIYGGVCETGLGIGSSMLFGGEVSKSELFYILSSAIQNYAVTLYLMENKTKARYYLNLELKLLKMCLNENPSSGTKRQADERIASIKKYL